jgi:hypothetical protein
MINTGIQYTADRKNTSRELPDTWTAEQVAHYGKCVSETRRNTIITCWHHGHIVWLYRNGRIA